MMMAPGRNTESAATGHNGGRLLAKAVLRAPHVKPRQCQNTKIRPCPKEVGTELHEKDKNIKK